MRKNETPVRVWIVGISSTLPSLDRKHQFAEETTSFVHTRSRVSESDEYLQQTQYRHKFNGFPDLENVREELGVLASLTSLSLSKSCYLAVDHQ